LWVYHWIELHQIVIFFISDTTITTRIITSIISVSISIDIVIVCNVYSVTNIINAIGNFIACRTSDWE
jgi:hypothetical protein